MEMLLLYRAVGRAILLSNIYAEKESGVIEGFKKTLEIQKNEEMMKKKNANKIDSGMRHDNTAASQKNKQNTNKSDIIPIKESVVSGGGGGKGVKIRRVDASVSEQAQQNQRESKGKVKERSVPKPKVNLSQYSPEVFEMIKKMSPEELKNILK
jgi:hypothetical protein